MMPGFPFGDTVTLITKTLSGVDDDGNDVYEETPTVIEQVPVWPRNSSELVQGQDTVIIGLTAFLPYDTDVSHIDEVEVNQKRYKVDGEPGYYQSSLTGTQAGVELQLTRVEG